MNVINLNDHYWIVAGDAQNVYSSSRKAFVVIADATYSAWVAAGGEATRIGSQAELDLIMRPRDFSELAEVSDVMTRLRNATHAQIDSWLVANLTNIAQARTILGTILKLLAARL